MLDQSTIILLSILLLILLPDCMIMTLSCSGFELYQGVVLWKMGDVCNVCGISNRSDERFVRKKNLLVNPSIKAMQPWCTHQWSDDCR